MSAKDSLLLINEAFNLQIAQQQWIEKAQASNATICSQENIAVLENTVEVEKACKQVGQQSVKSQVL